MRLSDKVVARLNEMMYEKQEVNTASPATPASHSSSSLHVMVNSICQALC